jgi:hypothetical protein
MTRLVVLAAAAVTGLLAMGSSAAAAKPQPVVTGDSVTAVGTSSFCGGPLAISAQSGPSGENPTGQISGACPPTGPVTCLDVSTFDSPGGFTDQTASLTVAGPAGPLVFVIFKTVRFGSGIGVAAGSDCTQTVSNALNLGFTGSIDIVDAPPLPTSKDQCKNGGWRTFGVFKNQGDCASFVATGGRNGPTLSP